MDNYIVADKINRFWAKYGINANARVEEVLFREGPNRKTTRRVVVSDLTGWEHDPDADVHFLKASTLVQRR